MHRIFLEGGWFDPAAGVAVVDGEERPLSDRERQLLDFLLAHPGQTLTREALFDAVWHGEGTVRVVDATVRRLRLRIERDPAEPDHLVTVHAEGYRLVLPDYDRIDLGDAVVDLRDRTWHTARGLLRLSHEEARLLRALRGVPVDRHTLQRAVWGPMRLASPSEVDFLVHQLRKKVEADPSAPRFVRTRPGRGYWLDRPGAEPAPAWTNLSPDPHPLVGRAEELAAARRALDEHRLVCLVGPGGAGKSRLARHLATEALEAGEAWLCDLSAGDDVCSAVAATLGVPPSSVATALAGRGPILVVLDDADEVADEAVRLARAWGPEVHVILTSRVRPAGAPLVEVGPLPPEDAVALFVARGGERRDDVPELPLAIEIAATLDAPGRSLSDTLGRSWDRLDPVARDVFAQLSVFAGPFSLEAFEGVVRGELSVLEQLHRRSLVHSPEPGRYALYATLRAFAADQLHDEKARDRHRAWFSQRAPVWIEAGAVETLLREAAELLAAGTPACALGLAFAQRGATPPATVALLDRSVAVTEDMKARLLVERALVRLHTGDMRGAVETLEDVDLSALSPEVADDVRFTRAGLAQRAGRWQEALDQLARVAGDDPMTDARRWGLLGLIEAGRGHNAEAEEAHSRAAAGFDALGRAVDRARELYNLAVIRVVTGRPARALGTLELALAAQRRAGKPYLVAHSLSVLGSALSEVGDLVRAEKALAEALGIVRRLGSRPLEATILTNLGNVLRSRGRPGEALELHRRAWQLHHEAGRASALLARLNIAADAISARLPEVARRELDAALAEGAQTTRVVAGAHCLCAVHSGLWGTPEQAEASVQAALAAAPAHGRALDEGRVLAAAVAPFADVARARAGDAEALDRVRDALSSEAPVGFQMVRWARAVLAEAAAELA